MCGLVGVAGNLLTKDEALMKRLFLLDHFRGPDSTGLAAVRTHSRDVKVAKINSHSLDLYDTGRFRDALNGTASSVFIGHNRAATRGAVTSMNAHPFHVGHIVGAHNGTLSYEDHGVLEKALDEKFTVDSNALIAAIARFGIDEAIGMIHEGKESMSGAWALVWYNQNENSLNFLRNKHRPFWYAFSKEFDRIFWASEYIMIDTAIKMTGGFELYQDSRGMSYYATEEDLHYKFDVAALVKGGKEKDIKPKVRQIKGKEPKAAVTTTSNVSPFPHVGSASTTGSTTSSGGTTGGSSTGTTGRSGSSTPGREKQTVMTKHLYGTTIAPLAGVVSRSKFNEMAKDGCCWCEKPVAFETPGVFVYEKEGIVLGPCCSGHNVDSLGVPVSRIYVAPATIDAMA